MSLLVPKLSCIQVRAPVPDRPRHSATSVEFTKARRRVRLMSGLRL